MQFFKIIGTSYVEKKNLYIAIRSSPKRGNIYMSKVIVSH